MNGDQVEDAWDKVRAIRVALDNAQVVEPYRREEVRVLKIAEELGEATAALIAANKWNPRKPQGSWADVEDELADVIITAMVALDTVTPRGAEVLRQRLAIIMGRMESP